MAALTKKDLLEAIEDMPMDAEIKILYFDEDEEEYKSYPVEDISTSEHLNTISLY